MRYSAWWPALGLSATLAACGLFQNYDGYADGANDGGASSGGDGPNEGAVVDQQSPNGDAGVDAPIDGASGPTTYRFAVGGRTGASLEYSASVIASRNASGGATPAWLPTSPLPTPLAFHSAVTTGSTVVVLGGLIADGSPSRAIYSAKLDTAGGLTAWTTQATDTPMGSSSGLPSFIAYNGYVYALEIGDAGKAASHATLASNGDVGSFGTATSIGVHHDGGTPVAAGGYIYLVGGQETPTRVDYARLNFDGSMGTWGQTAALGESRIGAAAIIRGGRLYVVGGIGQATITSAPIGTDGSLGIFTLNATNLSAARGFAGAAPIADDLWLVGGTPAPTTPYADAIRAPFVTPFGIGAWTVEGSLPEGRVGAAAAVIVK